MRGGEDGLVWTAGGHGELDPTNADGDEGADLQELAADGAAGGIGEIGRLQGQPTGTLDQNVSHRGKPQAKLVGRHGGGRGAIGKKVDLTLLNQLIGHDLIPVLAPLATSKSGQTFNVNADTFAGAVAGALKAKRLLLLTDVPGVLDKSKNLIPELSVKDARKLVADGTISGGMIPKVETCIYSLEQGVEGVVIIDGKIPHAVLLELFTNQGTGTLIHK